MQFPLIRRGHQLKRRFRPLMITAQREKELKDRPHRLRELERLLSAMQTKAITSGLDMEERSLAAKYERELGEWIDEDIKDWFIINPNGVMEYRKSKQLHALAQELRKGGYWGLPIA